MPPPALILDASVAAAWTLPHEINPASTILVAELRKRKYLPVTIPLFFSEFRNILVSNVNRAKIRKNDVDVFLRDMRGIGIVIKEMEDDALILRLAFQCNLSAYDAAYLALAVQEKAIMASNDKKLLQAAIAQGLKYRTTLEQGSTHA